MTQPSANAPTNSNWEENTLTHYGCDCCEGTNHPNLVKGEVAVSGGLNSHYQIPRSSGEKDDDVSADASKPIASMLPGSERRS